MACDCPMHCGALRACKINRAGGCPTRSSRWMPHQKQPLDAPPHEAEKQPLDAPPEAAAGCPTMQARASLSHRRTRATSRRRCTGNCRPLHVAPRNDQQKLLVARVRQVRWERHRYDE